MQFKNVLDKADIKLVEKIDDSLNSIEKTGLLTKNKINSVSKHLK